MEYLLKSSEALGFISNIEFDIYAMRKRTGKKATKKSAPLPSNWTGSVSVYVYCFASKTLFPASKSGLKRAGALQNGAICVSQSSRSAEFFFVFDFRLENVIFPNYINIWFFSFICLLNEVLIGFLMLFNIMSRNETLVKTLKKRE